MKSKRPFVFYTGIFTLSLLLLSAFFVLTLGQENSVFSSKIILKTILTNADGLRPGAAVRLKGIRIGTLDRLFFEKVDKIILELKIDKEYLIWIKKDSYIEIQTLGVLGDKLLEILGGTENSPSVLKGDFLVTKESSLLKEIGSKGSDLLTSLGAITQKIDLLLRDVKTKDLSEAIHAMKLSATTSQDLLNNFKNQQIINKVSSSLEALNKNLLSLESITQRIQTGPGTAHSLIYDDTLHEDMKELTGGAKRNKILRYFLRKTIESN